ncbi:unnamed protein product [Hermetia illucens]|uniref:HTH CENPB-type domain-containing protein n=1 Tax=Hermetia illucens TaxID=343691 RepID=A0A7R8YQY5_HERIL|nr:uncharacterized protein LOC119649210 [Hermetia illucens]CAD7082143.1 unnamed protein product [Hermetia illucens]
MDELSSISHMFERGKTFDNSGNVIRNRLNLEQRINVLKQYEQTPDIRFLSEKFECGRRQIKNILRKRKKYLMMWSRTKKRIPRPEFSLLNTTGVILHEWVKRARCYHINITDDILRSFGQEIADLINFRDFKPTSAWLIQFKQKYKLLNMELNIKQETDINPADRKPLGISIIIEDLRREYGDSLICPDGDTNENELFNEDSKSENSITDNFRSDSTDSAIQMDIEKDNLEADVANGNDSEVAKEISNYREALNQLGPLEQFALLKENIRAVGLINQLENLFREEMIRDELD